MKKNKKAPEKREAAEKKISEEEQRRKIERDLEITEMNDPFY